jgi:hypothetical protein
MMSRKLSTRKNMGLKDKICIIFPGSMPAGNIIPDAWNGKRKIKPRNLGISLTSYLDKHSKPD